MTFKKYLINLLQIYFVLVTLIFAASYIFGSLAAPDETIRYSQLAGPFILAAFCVVPSLITYFKKEPSLSEYIVRHVIQLAVIECIVLFLATPPQTMPPVLFRVILGLTVFAVYALVKLFMWLQKYLESKKLTDQLRALQKRED